MYKGEGSGKGVGSGRPQLSIALLPNEHVLVFFAFLRSLRDVGRGRGGSGKWMPTTFDCVAPERTLNRQFRIFEALRDAGRGGGGSGKWMPTTFDCVVPERTLNRQSRIFEVHPGCRKVKASEWEVDAHNF